MGTFQKNCVTKKPHSPSKHLWFIPRPLFVMIANLIHIFLFLFTSCMWKDGDFHIWLYISAHACQTAFAYRLLTARLLKRFKTQHWIGVELLWHTIEGGILVDLPFLLLQSELISAKEDVAALETKVWFLPADIKSLELFRAEVNSWAWFSKELNTKLNSEKQWWILPFPKRIQSGKGWVAYLKVWAFHWCISQGMGALRMYGWQTASKWGFWCLLLTVFARVGLSKASLELRGSNSIENW